MILTVSGRACGYPRKASRRAAPGRFTTNRHTGHREYGPDELRRYAEQGHTHLLPLAERPRSAR